MLTDECTLLGSGGARPGVTALTLASGDTDRILDLEPPGSAYALAVSPDGRMIAVGTRAGEVHLLLGVADAEDGPSAVRLYPGADVLSVCFLSSTVVATSDAEGRCLLWPELRAGAMPEALAAPDAPVCSLEILEGGRLAGLCCDGGIVVWDLSDRKIADEVLCPRPAPLAALVRLIHWPADGSLVYPAASGLLVRWRPDKDGPMVRKAHEGDFYALAVAGPSLITLGRHDRTFKTWRAGPLEPTSEGHTPIDALSCSLLDDEGAQLLCVSEQGKAGCYRLDGAQLRHEADIPGEDYRVSVGPGIEELRRFRLKREAEEADRTARRVRAVLQQAGEQAVDVERGLKRIEEIGYGHVALALRAEQAGRDGDAVGELAIRKKLVALLAKDDPHSKSSLCRYLELLDHFWQVEEADRFRIELTEAGCGWAFVEDLGCVADRDPNQALIIRPDLPVGLVIEAASALEAPLEGSFVLDELAPSPCHGATFDGQELVERYERFRAERSEVVLPDVRHGRVLWVSRGRVRSVETIILFGSGQAESLALALQVDHDGLQTVLAPSVLFVAQRAGGEIPAFEHNRRMSARLDHIQRGGVARSWLATVSVAVQAVVGRLINASGVRALAEGRSRI